MLPIHVYVEAYDVFEQVVSDARIRTQCAAKASPQLLLLRVTITNKCNNDNTVTKLSNNIGGNDIRSNLSIHSTTSITARTPPWTEAWKGDVPQQSSLPFLADGAALFIFAHRRYRGEDGKMTNINSND